MQTFHLLEKQKFNEKNAYTEPLHVDKNGRVILMSLFSSASSTAHLAPIKVDKEM